MTPSEITKLRELYHHYAEEDMESGGHILDMVPAILRHLEASQKLVDGVRNMDALYGYDPNSFFYGKGRVIMAADSVADMWRVQRDQLLADFENAIK